MVDGRLISNAVDLERELHWFREVLKTRSALNARKEAPYKDVYEVEPPTFNDTSGLYAEFVQKHQLDFEERFILILAMVPHLRPELLDAFLVKNNSTQQIYTEFGGHKGKHHNGFLPTGETAMFILAGNNLSRRFSLQRVFEPEHLFAKERIAWLDSVSDGEPFLNGVLITGQDALDQFTTGTTRKPNYSTDFPAKLLTTKMAWKDLVLNSSTANQISEIEAWLQYQHALMEGWGMDRKIKPGFRTLFYGPPGTGKTLTAALLGKKLGIDVYQIDLSKVISKYIGETEKNLSKIFDRAENKGWILFFDEAEALFGKRTAISDAHDRYANQEVAYLLQRVEDYNGLVILASNLKSNLDDAFTRRFQSMIQFPMPKPPERLAIWSNSFSDQCVMEDKIDMKDIAKKYELAGGSVINVVQHCSLAALRRGENVIRLHDLTEGIKREYHKNNLTI